MAVAWSSSGGVAILYELLVLCVTSCLAVIGHMAMCGLSIAKYSAPSGVERSEGSLQMSVNALFVLLSCHNSPESVFQNLAHSTKSWTRASKEISSLLALWLPQ